MKTPPVPSVPQASPTPELSNLSNLSNLSGSVFSKLYSKQLFHVVCEFIIIGLTSYYFYRKTNSLSNQIKILEAKIEKLESESKSQKQHIDDKLSEIISFVSSMANRMNPLPPVYHSPPQPRNEPSKVVRKESPVSNVSNASNVPSPKKNMTNEQAERVMEVQQLQNQISEVSRNIEQKITSSFGPSAMVNTQVILNDSGLQSDIVRASSGDIVSPELRTSTRADIIMMEVVIPSIENPFESHRNSSAFIEEYEETEFEKENEEETQREKNDELDQELEQDGLLDELNPNNN